MKNRSGALRFEIILFLVAMLIVGYNVQAAPAQDLMVKRAPVNPELKKMLSDGGTHPINSVTEAGGSLSLGYVPPPVIPEVHFSGAALAKIPGTKRMSKAVSSASAADARYDMRDPNLDGNRGDSLLPPVRDQGSCGSCWAFATYGSLESDILAASGVMTDFSENNLNRRHGFDIPACQGGNVYMSTAYLARHDGTIDEPDDPYSSADIGPYCTDCTPSRYIDNVIFLPVRSSVSDNSYIKQAVLTHGGLYTSLYWSSSYYKSGYTYYNNVTSSTNHAVTIVGWDDTKSVSGAPGPGAFIVRNSWGSGWGDGGYFYVSYYDKSIAFQSLACYADSADSNLSFDKIYSHDTLGYTTSFGYTAGGAPLPTLYGANWFTAGEDTRLTAVGFYATGSGTSYEITVYGQNTNGSFSNALAAKNGSVPYSGWYTIKLDTPVTLISGQAFGIAVKFTTPSGYPLAIEYPFQGYSGNAQAYAGQGYYSSDGVTWKDMTSTYANTSVCIKAFTKSARTTSLTVTAAPAAAVLAGAQWRVDGGVWRASGATAADLGPGAHQVEFKDISGWVTPSLLSVTLSEGQSSSLTGTYTPTQAGSVLVSLSPAAAVTAGAQWRLDGGVWNKSGVALSGVAAGSHTIDFKPVAGYNTPAPQAVTVTGNATASLSATYVASGSLLVKLGPAAVVSSGAMWRLDGGTWNYSGITLTDVPVGTHQVEFLPVKGWVTPGLVAVTITGGNSTSAVGTYVQQTGKISVSISPPAAVIAGARWSVDGGVWKKSGSAVTVPSGSHVITFKSIKGWSTPVSQTVQIEADGQSLALSGLYTKPTGSLTVTIGPNDAVSAGGKWRVDGRSWNSSGVTVGRVKVGSHLLEYKSVSGFRAPAKGTVTVRLNQETSVTGLYGKRQ